MNLTIISNGEIDVGAFTLIGVSTKRNDSTLIGKYGSGAKGAIAGLLRDGYDFKIMSGLEEIKVTVTDGDFRGTKFKRININGQATSITTDMHPQWNIKDYVREFYCNGLDEGEVEVVWDTIPDPQPGKTTVTISGELASVRKDWKKMFLANRKLLFTFGYGSRKISVYSGMPGVFCKGIWALDDEKLPKNLSFCYDIPDLTIREDRKSDLYYVNACIAYAADAANAEEFFNRCLEQPPETYEYKLVTESGTILAAHLKNADKFVIPAAETYVVAPAHKPHAVILASYGSYRTAVSYGVKTYPTWRKSKGQLSETPISGSFKDRIEEMIPSIKQLGYHCKAEHFEMEPLDEAEGLLARAEKGQIFWTKQGRNLSDAELFKTLLEETIHVEKELFDFSREMQDHLFEIIRKLVQ